MTTRREIVIAGFGSLLLRPAGATPESMRAAIDAFTGGTPARTGRVTLDIAPLVDNGNTVPVSVRVDSPMTAADHVKAIHVFVEKNPLPVAASFVLGPRCGRAEVSTRIRLADTQTVQVVCEMSDGTFWSGAAESVVTAVACTEAP